MTRSSVALSAEDAPHEIVTGPIGPNPLYRHQKTEAGWPEAGRQSRKLEGRKLEGRIAEDTGRGVGDGKAT